MSNATIAMLADSSQIRSAKSDLEALSKSGGKTEKVADRIERSFTDLNKAAKSAGDSARFFSDALSSVNEDLGQARSNLEQFISDQIKLGRTINENGDVLSANGQRIEALSGDYQRLKSEFISTANNADRLSDEMQKVTLATDKNQEAALEAKLRQYQLAEAAEETRLQVEKQRQTFNEAGKAYKNINKAADLAAKRSAEFSRKGAQASIQLEQLISTIAAGANPTQAFAFQAADLGIVLGAPLVGSAVAITAAIVGFVNAAEDAEEQADEFKEKLRELAREYELTTNQARAYNNLQKEETQDRQKRIAELQKEIEVQSEIYNNAEREIGQGRRLSTLRRGVSRSDELRRYRKESEAAAEKIALLSAEIESLQQEAGDLNQTLATNEAAESLRAQIFELEAGAHAAEIYAAAQDAVTEAEKAQLPETIKLINRKYEIKAAQEAAAQAAKDEARAIKEQQAAEKKANEELRRNLAEETQARKQADEEKRRAAEAERQRLESIAGGDIGLTQIQALEQQYQTEQQLLKDAQAAGISSTISYHDRLLELENQFTERKKAILEQQAQSNKLVSAQTETTLGSLGAAFGNFAEIASKGGKKSFETYKQMASAQALISTFLAANNALATPAPPPIPQVLAGSIVALGLANVAQIQSQTYQPRALGGQVTKDNSYLVGERGPELFTPNSSGGGRVTPYNQLMNQQGGGQQVTDNSQVNVNVQGVYQTGEELLLQNRDLIYRIVSDAKRRQGQRF